MQVGCTACQCAKGLCRTMYAPILFHLPGKPGAQLRICHCRQILAELPTMTAEPGRVHGLESADAPGKMRSRLLRARVDCFRPGGLSQSVTIPGKARQGARPGIGRCTREDAEPIAPRQGGLLSSWRTFAIRQGWQILAELPTLFCQSWQARRKAQQVASDRYLPSTNNRK